MVMDFAMHRARARAALAGNWGVAILVSLVAGLLGGSAYASSGFEININLDESSGQMISASMPAELEGLLIGVLGVSMTIILMVAAVMSIVCLLIGGAVSLGNARYNLNLIDKKEAAFNDLFSQLDRFGPALAMNLLINLYVFLWSLLFIIPGIVASYSYAMAPYIMLENPDCSASEAISRSKALMYGHRGELFFLELTFIGWSLLAALTGGIGSLWLNPYMSAARASFYRDLQNQQYRQPETPYYE